ncbi:hypothetical protein [Desulfomonile tiedjei]|uniref:DUF5683 domain-containing protein n=1 Tax=Desulfomonile tiedjei (strain ATCC 49306 / DSM 6799 / DCB-1) TaxID=706587 RepID=I4C2V9_DESTA|nr:hypothetical protein [Desulfomonile tiedjei]AFM23900.1 hypothetical protein Desti_1187 [Desulfomonile tiedjei DSM 6799]
MDGGKERDSTQSKSKSRIFSAVLSLVVPGLGQVVRGRIFAGLMFLLNVILYVVPLFMPQTMEYDVKTPALLIAVGVWVFSALDAFLQKSSFLILALLVSLFCFGLGFFGSFFLLPHLDI